MGAPINNQHSRKEITYEIDNKGCWVCTSHKPSSYGYPIIVINYENIRMNRFFLEQKLGRHIRKGYLSCHKCNNKMCINPEHLYEGTPFDNAQDTVKSGIYFNIKSINWSHKLTDKQALEIRESQLPQKDLSKLYNISQSLVSRIKSNKRWIRL